MREHELESITINDSLLCIQSNSRRVTNELFMFGIPFFHSTGLYG